MNNLITETEVSHMMWELKETPMSFNDDTNIKIADELVNRGLAEKTNEGYRLTKIGEKELMEKGGKTMAEGGKVEDDIIHIYKHRNKEKAEALSRLTIPYGTAFGNVQLDVDNVFNESGSENLKYKVVGYGGVQFMGNINGKVPTQGLYYKNEKIKKEVETLIRVLDLIENETRETIEYVEKQKGKPKIQHAILSAKARGLESGGKISQSAIEEGKKVELEHSGTIEQIKNNPNISVEKAAELIAIDHLNESPDYYEKLKIIESQFPASRIEDTDKKEISTCKCPTKMYHEKLTASQRDNLGNKYLYGGSTITDNKTGVVSDITEVQHNGFELLPQSSFENAPVIPFHVPFEELVNKHQNGQVSISGYESNPEDHKILILVVKDIMACNIIDSKDGEIRKRENIISQKENEILEKDKIIDDLNDRIENEVEEELELEPTMASGGVIGEVRATKNGVVKSIRDKRGKKLSSVYIGDTLYKINPASKTYTTEDNRVLFNEDIHNLNREKYSFESGAKSDKVDNLILFADNTRNLAEMRDAIYATIRSRGENGARPTQEEIQNRFKTFLIKTKGQYIRERGNDSESRNEVDFTLEQDRDFLRVYAEGAYGKYAAGGKTKELDPDIIRAKEYWDGLKTRQRLHFLLDHSDYVFDVVLDKIPSKQFVEYKKLSSNNWNHLPKDVALAVEEHLLMETYENGGELSGYNSPNANRNEELIGGDIKEAIDGILVLMDCTDDENEKEKYRQQLKEYDYEQN